MTIVAIIGGLLIAGIVIYGFRQGMKITPDDRPDQSGPNQLWWRWRRHIDLVLGCIWIFVIAGLDRLDPAIHPASKAPF